VCVQSKEDANRLIVYMSNQKQKLQKHRDCNFFSIWSDWATKDASNSMINDDTCQQVSLFNDDAIYSHNEAVDSEMFQSMKYEHSSGNIVIFCLFNWLMWITNKFKLLLWLMELTIQWCNEWKFNDSRHLQNLTVLINTCWVLKYDNKFTRQ